MADGDGAAVDIDLVGIPAEPLVDGTGLRREGLVGLDQVEVLDGPAGLPIGWPMAMAPPLTLTLSVSQPSPLLTAQACAAKASLASIRSRSLTVQPAFRSDGRWRWRRR